MRGNLLVLFLGVKRLAGVLRRTRARAHLLLHHPHLVKICGARLATEKAHRIVRRGGKRRVCARACVV